MDGFEDLSGLPPRASQAPVTYATTQRGRSPDELVGSISLTGEAVKAAGWKKQPERARVAEGTGANRGKVLITPDAVGQFKVRASPRGEGVIVRITVPKCLINEQSVRLPCTFEVKNGGILVTLPDILIAPPPTDG